MEGVGDRLALESEHGGESGGGGRSSALRSPARLGREIVDEDVLDPAGSEEPGDLAGLGVGIPRQRSAARVVEQRDPVEVEMELVLGDLPQDLLLTPQEHRLGEAIVDDDPGPARSTLTFSPSGKTTRLGARLARLIISRITSRALPRRRSRASLYSSMSISTWATPVAIAASATAADSQINTRGSKGLGIRYSGPKCSFSRP